MISQTSISAAKVKRATRRAKASNLRQGKMIKNHTEPASILADDHVDSAFAARTAIIRVLMRASVSPSYSFNVPPTLRLSSPYNALAIDDIPRCGWE